MKLFIETNSEVTKKQIIVYPSLSLAIKLFVRVSCNRSNLPLGVQHGVLHNKQPTGLPWEEKILPQYLQELGYKTHAVGKVLTDASSCCFYVLTQLEMTSNIKYFWFSKFSI